MSAASLREASAASSSGLQQRRCAQRSQAARSRRGDLRVCASSREVTLLDYGAGNVRSVRNAIKKLGYTIKDVSAGGSPCITS